MSISAQSCGDFTPSEVSVYYAARAPKVRQNGREWRGPCPIHNGTGDNFTVNAETGMWYCHSQCGRGGSMFDLEMDAHEYGLSAGRATKFGASSGRPALRQVDREPEMKWGLPGWSHELSGKADRSGRAEEPVEAHCDLSLLRRRRPNLVREGPLH